jgi:hypothetical protein
MNHTEAPIPLRPGEVIDLSTAHLPQDHLFAYQPGAPLPNRGPRRGTPTPPALPARPDLPQRAEAVRSRGVIGTVSGTVGVRIEPPPSAPQQYTPETAPVRKDYTVTNVDTLLKEAMQIDGAVGVALVDYTSGMTLGQAGGGALNMDVAAAGNTEVVRAKLRTMEALGLREGIEDILITLDTQYHIIRLISAQSGIGLFLYMALDKKRANLAMARHRLTNLERQIEI